VIPVGVASAPPRIITRNASKDFPFEVLDEPMHATTLKHRQDFHRFFTLHIALRNATKEFPFDVLDEPTCVTTLRQSQEISAPGFVTLPAIIESWKEIKILIGIDTKESLPQVSPGSAGLCYPPNISHMLWRRTPCHMHFILPRLTHFLP